MSNDTTHMSRRGFVASVAGVTLAAAGTAALPAGASASQAGDPTEESLLIEPLEAPQTWDEEFDVIVIGTGGGLAGAVRASQLGASVLLVDKMPDIGGASKEASVWVAPGTVVQESLGMPDVSSQLVEAAAASAPFGARWPLYASNVMGAAQNLVNWTVEEGFAWQPTTVTGAVGPVGISPAGSEEGGMTARAVMSVYEFLRDAFLEAGGDLRLSTTLEGLVTEGGAVIGVKLSDGEGAPRFVRAERGVLLATGGMGANRSLLQRFVPTSYEMNKCSASGAHDTGEGILMGLGAGAQLEGFDRFDQFDGGIDGLDWNVYLYNSAVQMARQPWLGITRHGERYPYIPGGGSSEYIAAAEQLNGLPGHEGFVFFDDLFEQYGPSFQQGMCRLLIDADTMPDEGRVPEALANPHWYEGVRSYIESGLIASGGTIEELAGKLGLDPDVAAKAVTDWNALCEQGTDPDGLMPDEFLYPIAQPPFYGMALGSLVFATHAGIAVNEHGQAINGLGNPIPGLFASGCAVGLPMQQANGSCCFAAASAYLAAESMAANAS